MRLRQWTWASLIACLVCVLVVAGCSSSPVLVQAVSGSAAQLAPYQLVERPVPWRIYPGLPQTGSVFYGEILDTQSHEVGHMIVVRYNSPAAADTAYSAIRIEAEFEKAPQPLAFAEIGIVSGPSAAWNASDLLFRTCNIIVHVTVQGNTVQTLEAFARDLYTRLTPATCE